MRGSGLIGTIIVLAIGVSGAQARTTGADPSALARSAEACSNASVYGGSFVGTLTLRFELLGAVSCETAHELINAFFARAVTGPCEGTTCITELPGGWTCSYFFAAESQETGGALAGCYQASSGTRIRVFNASQGASQSTASEFFVRFRRAGVACAMYDGHGTTEVLCETSRSGFEAKATLTPSGRVLACSVHSSRLSNRCRLGNAGEHTPTYHAGRRITVGRFSCRVLTSAVKCIVTATGKGFLFSPTSIRRVGGATL